MQRKEWSKGMKRVLVCEDEASIREFVVINLKRSGYEVIEAGSGEEALQKYDAEQGGVDIALLDIMLPGMDGFAVCRELRERSGTMGIIMLTARTQEADKVTGLMNGADDYVTKPFSIPILLRKIAAILRRTQREDELQVISYKTLSVDVKGHHVYICKAEKGEQIEVELTQKEFEMLYVLLINKGIVLTRQKLLNMVWGEDYYGEERIVDTHIKNIRKKLGVNLISTIRGVGYRIDKEN